MNTQTHAHDEQRIKHITMNQLYMNDESQCSGPVGRWAGLWTLHLGRSPAGPLKHPWHLATLHVERPLNTLGHSQTSHIFKYLSVLS